MVDVHVLRRSCCYDRRVVSYLDHQFIEISPSANKEMGSSRRAGYTNHDDQTPSPLSVATPLDRVVHFLNPCPLARVLSNAFSTKFLIFLTLMYGTIKGLAYQALLSVELPYFRHTMGIASSETYQKYNNISQMSYSLKPLVGLLSDTFPIFGYHKRYYIALYCLMSAGSVVVIALLEGKESNGPLAAALFFLAMLGVAAMDLLCEGKYSEMMAVRKDTGSGIVTWIWACYMLGGVVAASIEGPIADDANPRLVLWITVPFFLIPLVPVLLGWVPEQRKSGGTCSALVGQEQSLIVSPDDNVVGEIPGNATWSSMSTAARQHKGIAGLGLLTAFGALAVVVVSLLASNAAVLATVLPIALVLIGVSFVVLPRNAAKANLFMFCKELFYLQITGPLDYFYTSSPQCLPDGPHFSFTYYQTFGQIAANVAGMLGVFLFEKKLSTQNFQRVFWITTGIKVVAAFFDIVIVKRWNEVVGIPDKVMYMCGDAIIGQVAMMLDFMPVAVLMSRMCPKGMEATMYALLAGFSNFGQSTSRSIGYMAVDWMGIETSTVPCNFSNLPMLIAIGHMMMPLLIIPLSVFLVPNTSMQSDVLREHLEGEDDGEDGAHENGGKGPCAIGTESNTGDFVEMVVDAGQ
jgi:folate/biopterin transporter